MIGNRYSRNPGASKILSSMLKIVVVSVNVSGGTAEIIDENDQHKLSRESAKHFMTAWDLSRPPFCKSVVPNVCPFSQFFGWLISWRAGFLSLQTIKLLITYRMNFAALDNNSNGNLYLLSVRWNHNLL